MPNEPFGKNLSVFSMGNLPVITAVFLGIYFALVQFAYFFLLEVYLSSRALPFFICLFFWLAGFLGGLNLKKKQAMKVLLIAGTAAYYAAMLLTRIYPFQYQILPVIGLCIAISALLPGYYFPWAAQQFSTARQLFFHENNGFILGILISLLWALFAGQALLMVSPLAGAFMPAVLLLGPAKKP